MAAKADNYHNENNCTLPESPDLLQPDSRDSLRMQSEKALQESEEKILLLLNSAAEAIYGLDMDGNCTFCNNTCLRLLGYLHPNELLGKNMHTQIHSKHEDGTNFPVEDCRIY